jgi:predicted dehydrogenase
LKAAIWGVGNHAKKNLVPALVQAENIDLVGVFTRNKDSISQMISLYDCKTWDSSEEMLADKDLDLIFLSTPPGLHFRDGMRVLNSGKNLICEKPITTNYEETKSLLESAKKNNLFVFEAYMFLYHPHFLHIKKIIEEIEDDICEIQLTFELPKLENPGFRFNGALGGSCLYDVGSYTVLSLIELFQYENLLLENVSVTKDKKTNIDFSGSASFLINDNIRSTLKWSYNTKYINEIRIFTSDRQYYSEKIFSKEANYIPKIEIIEGNSIITEYLEARNHFISMLESLSEITTSEKKRNFEFQKIENLASILHKIKSKI